MFSLKLENELNNVVDINDGINYLVLDCTGLNPPKADIFTSKSPNRKGSKYNGSTLNERSINISIKLLGDIETNRNKLYEFIETEQYVKVRYSNNTRNVFIEGHIEECEFDPFTDNEIIELAILCENPYFKDLNEISIEISTLLNQLTFPISTDEIGIPFSTIKKTNETSIANTGSEVGLKMTITFDDNVAGLEIYDAKDKTNKITINRTFNANEYIILDTSSSPKKIILHKTDGTTENILKNLSGKITWFTLKKGVNIFGYKTNNNKDDAVSLIIEYANQYLGV